MKRIFLLLACLPVLAFAQDKSLMVEGASPKLFLSHTVVPKDNFYSIGRMYNVSPKEIAPFNKLNMEKGLNPGQVIKIPLIASNFSQDGAVVSGEALVPLYYTVQEKEGLYRIGINHNKLPVDKIKKWNHLRSDAVGTGTKLIVGYLKVRKDQSALAKLSEPVKEEAKTVTEEVVTPAQKPDEKPVVENKPIADEKPVVKADEKEKEIVVSAEKKELPKTENEPVIVNNKPGIDFNGGVFKNLYESQTNGNAITKEDGTAGIFKSTSGWKDGKYYCLHNTAPAGTIIKITNTVTGKSVYAKVLDLIPDIKQNVNLLIRISNAAADELGGGEANFSCTLNYSK